MVRLRIALFLISGVAFGTTFHVTNTSDSGAGSLRQALLDANQLSSPDAIAFNIPGAGVHRIAPLSALPAITAPVAIDGYTQPGAKPNTSASADNAVILIELDGAQAGNSAGLTVHANGCTIRGLSIHSFTADGINATTSNSRIIGNFIGTDPTGLIPAGNIVGIGLEGNGNTIGSADPADRNIVADSQNAVGISFAGDDNTIQGNFIGADATGEGDVHNHGSGVFGGGFNDLIGGTQPGDGNVIAFNHNGGVAISSGTSAGISILGNSIFGNGATSGGAGAIDLNYNDGTNLNDPGDADTGPNGLQNYPVLTAAETSGACARISFTVNSNSKRTYRIEFFANDACDSTGHGQGKTYLGFTTVATDGSGNAASEALVRGAPAGSAITATATAPDGSTSEFSTCVTAAAGTGIPCRLCGLVPSVSMAKVRHR